MGMLDKLFGKPKPKYETLGNTEPICPYCVKPLDKMPGRKTKCPFCANFIYARTRPADKKRVIVTEQDAAKIDEQWKIESGIEGPPMIEAIKHAQTKGTRIAAKYELTASTGEKIAQIVSDGIKTKRGIPGISRDIRGEFPEISKAKADNIAQTETADSMGQAFMNRSRDMGVTGKEWVCCPDACDICQSNAAVGAIPVDQPFPSGHMHPLAHDGCRCALAPVMLPEKEKPKKGKQ
jgi:hypothetical protein